MKNSQKRTNNNDTCKVDDERNSTDGPENKKTHDNAEGIAPQRRRRQTVCVMKRRRKRSRQHSRKHRYFNKIT